LQEGEHMVLTSPDELILVSLRRVTNGGTDNVNTVFGLMVDIHYEADRFSTPNKAAPFWMGTGESFNCVLRWRSC
jgi:hypothetical protein